MRLKPWEQKHPLSNTFLREVTLDFFFFFKVTGDFQLVEHKRVGRGQRSTAQRGTSLGQLIRNYVRL